MFFLFISVILINRALGSVCNESDSQFVYLPEYGCIKGTVFDEYRVFKGIPFASPPTLDLGLRFEKPIQHPNWFGQNHYDATEFSARACNQVLI